MHPAYACGQGGASALATGLVTPCGARHDRPVEQFDDILVLVGTRDGAELAKALGARTLPLVPSVPVAHAVSGPFDTAIQGGWRGIICAAHPFDDASAARVRAWRPDVPLLNWRRPGWDGQGAWACHSGVAQAVQALPPGLRVLAATGRESEAALAAYPGEVLLRQNRVHNAAPSAPHIHYQFGTGAFDSASEEALFTSLEVEALLVRNLGGARGYGKVKAALRLGLPVHMVDPPALVGSCAQDIQAVRQWLGTLPCA